MTRAPAYAKGPPDARMQLQLVFATAENQMLRCRRTSPPVFGVAEVSAVVFSENNLLLILHPAPGLIAPPVAGVRLSNGFPSKLPFVST